MLPKNFTFQICGRDELSKFANKKINYFIGFNHPGQLEEKKYSYEAVNQILGSIEYFSLYEVHDTWTKEHRETGYKMPDKELVGQIICDAILIAGLLRQENQVNLLCGCQIGKSRSTATLYIILCYLMGEWNEREALKLVEKVRSIAHPNALMVKLADDLMNRGYKMVAPLKNALDLEREEDKL